MAASSPSRCSPASIPQTGAPVLEGVTRSSDAAEVLGTRGTSGIWLAHLTIGNRTIPLADLAAALLGTAGPEELALADEAASLGLLPRAALPALRAAPGVSTEAPLERPRGARLMRRAIGIALVALAPLAGRPAGADGCGARGRVRLGPGRR